MRILNCVIAALAISAYGCGQSEPENEPEAATEEAALAVTPDDKLLRFELPDMTGRTRLSGEWEGKPKLVNFWATWCAPCRREIPLLKQTQDEYTDLGLQVIGIAVDFNEDVVAYAEEADFNYPILVGQEDAMAVAERTGVEFIGLPFTMVVAPSGEVIKTHIGEIVEEHIVQITDVIAQMQRGELDISGARAALGNL